MRLPSARCRSKRLLTTAAVAVGGLTMLLAGPGGSFASTGITSLPGDAATALDGATTQVTRSATALRAATRPASPATRPQRAPVRQSAPASPARTTAPSARAAQSPADADVQGTNPHGQGTVLAVSVGQNEAIVVGRSRGEQKDGQYHGHVTTLALFGQDVIAGDTNPGQTSQSPFAPLQQGAVDPLCTASGGNLCADALRQDSATTTTGSQNHFRAANLVLGGPGGVTATAAESHGSIEEKNGCQIAHGDVTLANLAAGGTTLLNVGQSASDSQACPSGTTTHNTGGPLVTLAGRAIPLPGCGSNQPGTLVAIDPLLSVACNAGSAAGALTTNSALTGTVLQNGTLVAGGTGAAAQPPAQPAATTPAAGKVLGNKVPHSTHKAAHRKPNAATPAPAGPPRATREARALPAQATGKLPFTGYEVVLSIFIAAALLAGGLGTLLAPRPHA